MFDIMSDTDKLPKPAPQQADDIRPLKQPGEQLSQLLNEAYRRGYSAGHKAGFDAACKVSAK